MAWNTGKHVLSNFNSGVDEIAVALFRVRHAWTFWLRHSGALQRRLSRMMYSKWWTGVMTAWVIRIEDVGLLAIRLREVWGVSRCSSWQCVVQADKMEMDHFQCERLPRRLAVCVQLRGVLFELGIWLLTF